jgi:hypothetical protein
MKYLGGGNFKKSIVKNVISLFVGTGIGLYFGQYFPDLYYR